MSRFLLDTHAFLWFAGGDSKLTDRARALIEDKTNECAFSVASVWEIAIKSSLGRLELARPLESLLRAAESEHAIKIRPVVASHALAVQSLPRRHGDPFDRLPAAVCRAESLEIISADQHFDHYEIRRVW